MTRKEAAMILGVDFANAIGTLASLPPSIRKKSELNKQILALDMAIKALAAEDVKHGEWIKDKAKSKKYTESIYICSECKNFEAWGDTETYNYCPSCGAKMKVGKE